MLAFLQRIWNDFTSGLEHVYHWVLNLIAVVYSYINRLFNALASEVLSVWHQLQHFADAVGKWVTQEVAYLIKFIETSYHDLLHWASVAIHDVASYAETVYHWALKEFDYVTHWVSTVVNAVVNWVIKNIWQPLYDGLTTALNWITREGAYVWDIITHPEKLAAILAAYLLKSWLFIIRTWAKPIASYILRHAMSLIPDLVSILEDAISKVL